MAGLARREVSRLLVSRAHPGPQGQRRRPLALVHLARQALVAPGRRRRLPRRESGDHGPRPGDPVSHVRSAPPWPRARLPPSTASLAARRR